MHAERSGTDEREEHQHRAEPGNDAELEPAQRGGATRAWLEGKSVDERPEEKSRYLEWSGSDQADKEEVQGAQRRKHRRAAGAALEQMIEGTFGRGMSQEPDQVENPREDEAEDRAGAQSRQQGSFHHAAAGGGQAVGGIAGHGGSNLL